MTTYIGTVSIPSVQEVLFDFQEEAEEIDITNDSENVVLDSDDEGISLDINFTIYGNNLQQKKEEIEGVSSTQAIKNDFVYDGLKGYLSVEDVSLPEVADNDTIIEGTITGQFYPWPKNFPDLPEPQVGEREGIGGFGRYFGTSFGGS